MHNIHNTCKAVYFKIRSLPVIGRVANYIAPKAHHYLKRLSQRSNDSSLLSQQLDAHLIALLALQKSTNTAYKEMQSNLALLENKLYAEIEFYRERLEFVRLEIFEQIQAKTSKNLPAPQAQILSQEKVDHVQMNRDICINVGCGHKPLAEYLNIDRRALPGVDIVAPAHALPFSSKSVKKIHAAHLLEHFTLTDLKNNVLPYWHELLEPGGCLSIIVPDSEAMIAAYTRGELVFSDLRSVIFGSQDYDDDFHFIMFSEGSLSRLLRETGFKRIEFAAFNRTNGKCREMEVAAWK